jgi:hypothetical protein
MTDAQIMAMLWMASTQNRKQSIANQQYKLTQQIGLGITSQTVTFAPPPPTTPSNPNSQTGPGAQNPPPASQQQQATASQQQQDVTNAVDTGAVASQQSSTLPNSTTNATNTQTDAVTAQTAPKAQGSSDPNTVTIQVLRSEITTTSTLENTLAAALTAVAKKQFQVVNPLATPAQLAAFESAIQKYINTYANQLANTASASSLGPSELFLKIPSVNALNLNSSSVNAATAVSFAEYIIGLVNSGDLKTFANSYIFPDDPASAKTFAANANSALLDIALEQVGTALNIPNLGQQVLLQAQLVRDENDILKDPAVSQSIVSQVVDNQQLKNLSAADLTTKLTAAIDQTNSQGPYLTREDLQAALASNLQTAFPENPNLATQLATQLETATLDQALSSQSGSYSLPGINPGDIDLQTAESSIALAVQQSFIDSDREVRQAKLDDVAAKQIIADVAQKQYTNELAVRSDIQSQLLDNIPDLENLEPNQAANIAASVNLGIPPTGPLYTPGDQTLITPQVYSQAVQASIQSNAHTPPQSDFGQAIQHVAGTSVGYDNTSMVALVNKNVYDANLQTRSYLDLPASEQEAVRQTDLLDPAKKLVNQWGSVVNGLSAQQLQNQPGSSQAI